MVKKVLLALFVLFIAGMVIYAGGKKEAEPAPEEVAEEDVEDMAEEEEAAEEEGPQGTGIAYKAPIDIGTKNFTEQFVVGNLMYIYLEEEGFDVALKTGMTSTVLREAMENGDLDLCMDYTGTQWLSYTGHEFKGESPKEMYRKAKESDAERGLIWMDPIWCNNTYAIAVTREFSEKNGIKTLSDFADYVKSQEGEVRFASDFEFYSRPDGLLALQQHYDFVLKPEYVSTALPGLSYEPLIKGRADFAMVFGTDSIIQAEDWVVLQDDKNFWPPYDLAPYTRLEVLEANPGLDEALNRLVNAFPDDPAEARSEMSGLNAKVDIDKMEPEEAAEEWLKEKGLID